MAIQLKPQSEPQESSPLQIVLGYVGDSFSGDLKDAATKAARRAKAEGFVSGALWDEIGARVLSDLYRIKRIHRSREEFRSGGLVHSARDKWESAPGAMSHTSPSDHPAAPSAPKLALEMNGGDRTASSIYAQWFKIGERWYQLGDMTKADCDEIAAHYLDIAKSNEHEARWFARLADGLNTVGQTVQDRYTPEEILQLREES